MREEAFNNDFLYSNQMFYIEKSSDLRDIGNEIART